MCPGRKKGEPFEHETFIADQGETDKRRLMIEAELAGVLKAMRREGNNLSPVIRPFQRRSSPCGLFTVPKVR